MLTIDQVYKEYRTGTLVQKALDGVSISFREREFVAILGPSGSGKTTLLNVIGGLDRYDSGEMTFNSVPTSSYGNREWDTYRNHTIGFIFQSYNLIPHQSILSNVELALTLAGVKKEERLERSRQALDRVGLLDQAFKKPMQLSGGQMQRVAIARALVNHPSVLLADEPTGALDSDTGEQVMKLLKEVSEDHLVIMVTHNPDLARRYATRIVQLRDGKITDDSDPYDPKAESSAPEAGRSEVPSRAAAGKKASMPQRKSSMSFLTALSLSVSNLFSKKARTILVAFAASIGIVGIALILSLSNGANAYIHQMERDSLSQYPIEITSSAFSMEETMMTFAAMRQNAGTPEGDQITEQQMMGGMLSSASINDLASLKRWFDSGYSGMEDYTRGIDYSYGISPQIYRLQEDGYRQVNPDQTMAAFGVSMDDALTGAMSGYSFNEVFVPLPANPSLYEGDYDLLAGSWPKKDTDLVLVLSGSGGIPDFMLYTMGLKDSDELNEQIQNVVAGNGSGVKTEDLMNNRVYDPEDFLGISFKLLPAYSLFEKDKNVGLWLDQSGNEKKVLKLLKKAEDMKIVGVVRPSDDVSFGILGIGLEYQPALLKRLMRQAEKSDVVRAQNGSPDINILTGTPFGEDDFSEMGSYLDMIELHPEHLDEAVSIRWDRLGDLETDDTRLTAKRLVRITRELSRTGKSPTLEGMLQSALPLLKDMIEIDEDKIGDVISFAMDESRMQEMYSARAAAQSATLSGNLTRFGYADEETPMRVTIYPSDFDSKSEVIRLLDAYNEAVKEEGYEDKVISYTDYVGALMSSVTTIIDVITYVLIAFVAVSLVVSSIMIGIITYISVLERRKEIGILRAMGASRYNITQVFNAETFIIGLLSGAFGMGITLAALVPINIVIQKLAEQRHIRAFLPPGAGAVLIGLCVVLTFIGGFIPSRQAARQDPVAALRSE